jgi:hypothetical protein
MRKDEDTGEERSRRNGDWCRRWSGLVALIAAGESEEGRGGETLVDAVRRSSV